MQTAIAVKDINSAQLDRVHKALNSMEIGKRPIGMENKSGEKELDDIFECMNDDSAPADGGQKTNHNYFDGNKPQRRQVSNNSTPL